MAALQSAAFLMSWASDLKEMEDSILGELGEETAIYQAKGALVTSEVAGIFEENAADIESLQQGISSTKPIFLTRLDRLPALPGSEGDRLTVRGTQYYIHKADPADGGMVLLHLNTARPT